MAVTSISGRIIDHFTATHFRSDERTYPFLGDLHYNFHYAQRWCSNPEPVKRKMTWIRSREAFIRKSLDQHGICHTSQVRIEDAWKDQGINVPLFPELIMPCPSHMTNWMDSIKSNLRNQVRRAEKTYTSKISHSEADFLLFVNRQYLPTTKKRHGIDSHVETIEKMEYNLKHGYLIKSFNGGTWLGGMICSIQNGCCCLNQIGCEGGDPTLFRDLTLFQYMAAIRYAIEANCREIILGGTHPFIEGGLFYFKDKFGGYLDIKRTHRTNNYLFIRPHHPNVVRFFQDFSLIFWKGNTLAILTAHQKQEDWRKKASAFHSLRDNTLAVYSIHPSAEGSLPANPSSLPGCFRLLARAFNE